MQEGSLEDGVDVVVVVADEVVVVVGLAEVVVVVERVLEGDKLLLLAVVVVVVGTSFFKMRQNEKLRHPRHAPMVVVFSRSDLRVVLLQKIISLQLFLKHKFTNILYIKNRLRNIGKRNRHRFFKHTFRANTKTINRTFLKFTNKICQKNEVKRFTKFCGDFDSC